MAKKDKGPGFFEMLRLIHEASKPRPAVVENRVIARHGKYGASCVRYSGSLPGGGYAPRR